MEMISVAFDTENWREFAFDLEESVPEKYGFSFDIGPNPLASHWFCQFIHRIKRPWTLRSDLYGPGFQCLRVNREKLNCVGITTVYTTKNDKENFYFWLRRPVLLARVGYDVRVEVEIPDFVPNADFVRNATHGLCDLGIVTVPSSRLLKKGIYGPGQSCNGEFACIWSDGKYYPCWHCVDGGLRWSVYSYGKLGEPFEKTGREVCKLADCLLR